MLTNLEIAHTLRRLGLLLELSGEARSRNRILRHAADLVEEHDSPFRVEDLAKFSTSDLGEEPRDVITELLSEGVSSLYQSLCETWPEFLVDIAELKGIGITRVQRIYNELHVRTPEELVRYAQDGSLNAIKGIGKKTAQRIEDAARSLSNTHTDDASPPTQEAPGQTPAPTEDTAPDEDGIVSPQNLPVESAVTAPEPPPSKETTPEESEEPATAEPDNTQDTAHRPDTSAQTDSDSSDVLEETEEHTTTEPEAHPHEPTKLPFWSTLRCTACQSPSLRPAISGESASCEHCGRSFRIEDGIPDMVGSRGSRSLVQSLMEFRPYTHIYERLARPVLSRVTSRRRLEEEFLLHADLLELRPGLKVLDIACGPGNFARYFAEILQGDPDSNVFGLDISWPMLNKARENCGAFEHLKLIRGDATRLPIADNSVDRTHCATALHLFQDPTRALREMARVTKPGGLVVIGTFLRTSSRLEALPASIAKRTAGITLFRADDLQRMFTNAGLHITHQSVASRSTSIQAEVLE